MADTKKVAADFHIVALESNMDHWNIPDEILKHIEGVREIYTFDSSEHTYCCETTPSYWMELLEYRPVLKAYMYDDDMDAIRDKVDSFFAGVRDDDGGKYMHVHSLDAIVSKLKSEPFRYAHIGEPFGDIPEDEIEANYTRFDAVRELWNANPPL